MSLSLDPVTKRGVLACCWWLAIRVKALRWSGVNLGLDRGKSLLKCQGKCSASCRTVTDSSVSVIIQ